MKSSFSNKFRGIRAAVILFILVFSTFTLMANNITAGNDNGELIEPIKVNGYHTYAETNATLYSIEENYTSIVKIYNLGEMFPWPNGTKKTTLEGRDVLAIKISDNPELNEADEPEILYCGVHHAREWISNEVPLYFLRSIVENYTKNDTITDLINNREIWIVPIVNPDGYYYSQEVRGDHTKQNGNQWRKNCNESNGIPGFQDNNWASGDGVDPNRNYGYKWGYDNTGSSPNPNDSTYRGTAPFSEVETQLIRDLALDREFKLALTFHSHGQLILWPWGYISNTTPDAYLFEAIGNEMSKYNGYTPQQGYDLYPANGDTTDWLYANRSCLAFTVELGTVFIPPESQIEPICLKNYEPCVIIAQIADNPFKIFISGIAGKITNTQDVPLEGVKVNTTFMGNETFCITNSTGEYKIILPPDLYTLKASKTGFETATRPNVIVSIDQYTTRNIKLKDIVAPIITSVTSSVGTDTDNSYDVADIVRINVTEKNNEPVLTGTIEINSSSQGYDSGKLELVFNTTTNSYIYDWNTFGMLPADDYVIESNLTDFDLNFDGNGSNDTGPDLVIKLTDIKPPVVSNVDSAVGADTDEVYETNSIVRISVYEMLGELNLTGTVVINSTKLNYTTGVRDLNYDGGNNLYYREWNTSGLEPSDDFWVETTLEDHSHNIDLDGLLQTPDLVITLRDTIPPEIQSVYSYAIDPLGDKDTDGKYEIRSIVHFKVVEKYGEGGLSGTINITSLSASYTPGLQTLQYDDQNEEYYYIWDTAGLPPATDYFIETVLTDNYSNSDPDGANNTGPDLIIELQDTIAPKIVQVDSYVLTGPWGEPSDPANNDEQYELGSVIRIQVFEELNDTLLTGTIRIYSVSQTYDIGKKQLSFDNVTTTYYWDWDTTGLSIGDDYRVDTTLQDAWGNKDSDGSIPTGPDLVIKIEDSTAPIILEVSSIVSGTNDTDGSYELGEIVRIIVSEQNNELGLYGTVRITSNSTGYDSGIQLTYPNIADRTYYWDWDTSAAAAAAADFEVETTLTDAFNNSDSDGLMSTPDLTIVLEDNTPPSSVTNVKVEEDPNNAGEIHITWDGMEDGASVYVFRSTSPIDEDNITSMDPVHIGAPDEMNYTDFVPADGSTYYYAVVIEDADGNINWGLTDNNTGSVKVSKPGDSEDDSDDILPWAAMGMMCWLILIIIIVIIVVIIVAIVMVISKRRRQPPIPPYDEGEYDRDRDDLEEPPRDRPRKGKRPPVAEELELDWDAEPVKKTLPVKPGSRPKKHQMQEQDLDDVRAELWDDIQDEYGVQPVYIPQDHGNGYDESPVDHAEADHQAEELKAEDKDKESEEDEEFIPDEEDEEEVFEVEFDEDEDEEVFEIDEEQESDESEEEEADIDWE